MNRGTQVLVGGAERLHRQKTLGAFVALAGGDDARIGVVTSATESPEAGGQRALQAFAEVGVRHPVVLLAGQGAEAETAALKGLTGLWYLGGDQTRAVQPLWNADGEAGSFLRELQRRSALPLAEGGLVVGGTSAGAALMSNPMITGGTSGGALALPRATGPGTSEMTRGLSLARGTGLFPEGVVDQHFDARARLGRLLEACLVEDGAKRLAFGIDEATALIRQGHLGRLSVAGAGSVWLVDPRKAVREVIDTPQGPQVRIRGAVLHSLTEGDTFTLDGERAEFPTKEALDADPGFAFDAPEATGVLSPYGRLGEFVARMLLDNRPDALLVDRDTGHRFVRSLLWEGDRAWEVRFLRVDGTSRLWYDGRYSVQHVVVDLLPLMTVPRWSSP